MENLRYLLSPYCFGPLEYTGVGSREAPAVIVRLAALIARKLAKRGYTLRSGHADGMDDGFEQGAGKMRVYLPESGFNGAYPDGVRYFAPPMPKEAEAIARELHPHWFRMGDFGRAAHTRNVHQVLGDDLDTPSRFLICWTPGGKVKGGTATAIRLAHLHNVPVFNLAITSVLEHVVEVLEIEWPEKETFHFPF